jgi:O-methyltransferase involved in polyketide biosynthesis
MASKQAVRLGTVPETLLVPLYARAVESRRKHPILDDPKAIGMVDSIDWDFQRFNQRWRVIGCALRSAMFDEWVKGFLRGHPEGTVVEIGCGLNTRFERLDNGRLHWFDLDLPEVIELRRKFFADSERRTTLAASVLDPDWIAAVRRSPGPYFFVAEAVLVYLQEPEVKAALAQIAANFPDVRIAFDTTSHRAVSSVATDHGRRNLAARFVWACDDPRNIEDWNIGLRLVESRTPVDVPEPLNSRLSWRMRTGFRVVRKLFPKLVKAYQLNLFAADAGAPLQSGR